MPLIAVPLYMENEDVPSRDHAVRHAEEVVDRVRVADVPCVKKRRVQHRNAERRAEEDIRPEYTRRGDADQNRQIRNRRHRDQMQKSVPVRVAESRNRLCQRFHQTHHQTAGYDRRQDRDEYVAERLDDLPPERRLCRGCCLHVLFCRSRCTGNRQKLIINLVDRAGSDDELQLSAGLEHALHAFDVVERLLVDLVVVGNNEAEPRRAVCRGNHVLTAANIHSDLFRALSIVKCHTPLPSLVLCFSLFLKTFETFLKSFSIHIILYALCLFL